MSDQEFKDALAQVVRRLTYNELLELLALRKRDLKLTQDRINIIEQELEQRNKG